LRLLFIYFYKEQATFKEGTVIRFSKKYTEDIKVQNQNHQFDITLTTNENYQDDFYSNNSDIGVIIGENGTGKSILINSIRDKNNNYSIIVYENDEQFYFINHAQKEVNIVLNDKNEKVKKINNNFDYIYYSSILDTSENDIKSDYNISNRNLLNKYDDLSLNNRLSLIENDDIHKYFNLPNKEILGIKEITKIKVHSSKTYFDEIEEKLFTKYNNQLMESIFNILNNKPEEKENRNFIFKILKNFPQSFKKEVLYDSLRYEQRIFYLLLHNKKILDNYFEKVTNQNGLEQYNEIFEAFYVEIKKIQRYHELMKLIERNFYEDIFYDNHYLPIDMITSHLEFELTSIFSELYDLILQEFRNFLSRKTDLLNQYQELFRENEENVYLKVMNIIYKRIVNEVSKAIIDYMQDKKILEKQFKNNIEICLKIFILKNERLDKLNFEVIDIKLYDQLVYEAIRFKYLNIRNLFKNETIEDESLKIFLYNNIKNIMINLEPDNIDLIQQLFILRFRKSLKTSSEDFLISRALGTLNMLISVCDNIDKYINFDIEENKNIGDLTLRIDNFFDISNKIKTQNILDGFGVKIDKGNSIFEVNDNFFKFYEFIIKDKVKPFTYEIEPSFSSGEKAKLVLFGRINDAIEKINKSNRNKNILILLDEADLKLHLEWQRKFVNDLIEFLNNYSDNKFYILYATHSPMILSDITNDRIVFLKKEENSKFSVDRQNFDKRTFGANIYDIYNDSFFMKSFMGEFAEKKINEAITSIELHKKKENIANEEALNLLKIVSNIGEPLLRNKLEDEIKSLSEIQDDITQIANNLKDKNFEEIKQELKKHSQSKQKKILEKLFGNQND
jgi:predicted ATPase